MGTSKWTATKGGSWMIGHKCWLEILSNVKNRVNYGLWWLLDNVTISQHEFVIWSVTRPTRGFVPSLQNAHFFHFCESACILIFANLQVVGAKKSKNAQKCRYAAHTWKSGTRYYYSTLAACLAGNVGKCVCRLQPSNDRHFCLSPTCWKCRPDTSATFCYVSQFFGCRRRARETCCRHTLRHVRRNQ